MGRGKTAWECHERAAISDNGQLEKWIVGRFLRDLPQLRATARAASPRFEELEWEAARARDAHAQWRDDTRVQQRLGMDMYLTGLQARQDRLNVALAELAVERTRIGVAALPDGLEDLAGRWDELTRAEQRRLLQSGIRCVFVRGSRRTAPLDDRLRVVWQGEPLDLPSRGRRGWTARPFLFND